MLRASGGEKIWFLCYYAINMARYNWQTGNSDVRETRNSVINASEICAKELWHDDCIFPKRKMAETAFLALLHTEWCTKRCFCILTIRRECGNKDKQSTFFYLQKCTNCSSLRNFYILLFRHLLFVGVLWFPFLKLHFPNYSFWYQLSWFLSKYHYYSFFSLVHEITNRDINRKTICLIIIM